MAQAALDQKHPHQVNLPGMANQSRAVSKGTRAKHGESLRLLRFHREQAKTDLLQARVEGDYRDELRYADELDKIDRRIKRRERNLALMGHDAGVSKFEAMQYAIHRAPVESEHQRSVMVYLASIIDADTRTSTAKVPVIARSIRASESTVKRAITRLIQIGECERRHRYRRRKGADGKPRRYANEYVVATHPGQIPAFRD